MYYTHAFNFMQTIAEEEEKLHIKYFYYKPLIKNTIESRSNC